VSRGLGGWLVGAAVALVASTAFAGPSVLVVVDAGATSTDADVARLRSELGALGFEVSTMERPPGVQAIDELARARGAEAAVRLIEQGARVEIWLRDRATGRTVVREVIVEDPDPERAASVLAVRAGELLRASLLDAASAPPPQAADAAAATPTGVTGVGAAPVSTPARDEPRPAEDARRAPWPSWAVEAGPTMFWMPGQDVTPMLVITIGARLLLAPWLAVGVRADLPTFAVSVEGSEGKAEIHAGSVSTMLRIEPAPLRWRLQPFAEVAVGGGWVDVSGASRMPGYVAHDGSKLSVLAALRGGARLRVVAPLSLRVDAGAAMSLPPVRVTFAGREVLEVGRPWLMAGVGVDCAF
jgi:hypothetical protein